MTSLGIGRLSLTARLTVWYVGLLALLLLGLGIVLLAAANRLSSAAALGEASIESRALRDTIQTAVAQGLPLGMAASDALGARAMQTNAVEIDDASGQVVARSGAASLPLATIFGTAAPPLEQSANEWLGVFDGGNDGSLAVSVVRLSDPRSATPIGSLVVGVSVNESVRIARALLVSIGLGFGAVLVIAVAIGPRLTRLGLRPLRSIAAASRELAKGNLSARVPTSAVDDEIGALACAFNEMATQLEVTFETQRAFVADASHELRTPLNALGGLVDVLVRVIDTQPSEARRLAGHMRPELDRMAALVDDLLVLARLEAQGPTELDLQRVDVGAVARDVYEQARVLPAARGRELALHVGPRATLTRGEPRRLHQVLLNLTTNALQHAPDGGHVRLCVDRCTDREAVRVEVHDDGPGIPADQLARIFDRFYRTDGARARVDGGTGLGLAIARAIVNAHAGSIHASNAAEGGAVFSVQLPIVE